MKKKDCAYLLATQARTMDMQSQILKPFIAKFVNTHARHVIMLECVPVVPIIITMTQWL